MKPGRIIPSCRLVYQADRLCTEAKPEHTHVLIGTDRLSNRIVEKRYVTELVAKRFCQRHALFMPVTTDPALPMLVDQQTDSQEDHQYGYDDLPIVTPAPTIDPSADFRARAAGDDTQE